MPKNVRCPECRTRYAATLGRCPTCRAPYHAPPRPPLVIVVLAICTLALLIATLVDAGLL